MIYEYNLVKLSLGFKDSLMTRFESILNFLSCFDKQILKITTWEDESKIGIFNFFLTEYLKEKYIISTPVNYGEVILFDTYGEMNVFEIGEIETIEVISDPVILTIFGEHGLISNSSSGKKS
ncbi:hypothetical protein [Leptospira sp. id769339]|uniref:hypothetical protein n=1 Tax=Leptospira sp. id769339 TaxID=2864221 RepID=UPI00214BF3C9|nr:hypothetical protein [Leptospira sp. id769339]MCR1795539.1 hypothetical protein [Leptospira sp. id769339]